MAAVWEQQVICSLLYSFKDPVIMALLNHLHTQIMLNSTLKMEIDKQHLCSHLH